MAATRDPYLVFISHSSRDRWIAGQMATIIRRRAKRHGVRTFLDEADLVGGDRVLEVIRDNLRACDEFVILLTPHSIERRWVLLELGGAWTTGKRIMAVVDNVAPAEMPDIIEATKTYDLGDFDRYVAELIRRARSGP